MSTRRTRKIVAIAGAATAAGLIAPMITSGAGPAPAPGGYDTDNLAMAHGTDGWTANAVFTVGEALATTNALGVQTDPTYSPPGILDGLGAYELDGDTVRVFANHEMLHFRGYDYEVSDGVGGTFTMGGARVSYFDIDKSTREVVDSGLAYNTIYDATGAVASDTSFLTEPYAPFFGGPPGSPLEGFSRFCSGSLFEPHEFGRGRGLEDRIHFAGEEDGGGFNSVGGAEWALDPETGNFWALPDLGRGAWENVTVLDTGDSDTVAILLADDTEPFDFDGDGELEAAPLFLYVGEKDPGGDFPARNGLRGGKLHVWVADNGDTDPTKFNTSGQRKGEWVEIDNSATGTPSQDGTTGFDEYGYPTQGTLWLRAKALGAFGFSRPEDVATNPSKGTEAVLASTGVDTYVGGADSFGTMYTVTTNFKKMTADVTIFYDGDADPTRALRSPDNLDWADDGRIYIQEDEAEEITLTGEPLFGEGAANPNEAGIVRMNKNGSSIERIANINRGVALDASLANPTLAFDQDYGNAGEWESSGILDVSSLFGEKKGTLFLFDVQAHGVDDQETQNPESRIRDSDLREGGQLLFLARD